MEISVRIPTVRLDDCVSQTHCSDGTSDVAQITKTSSFDETELVSILLGGTGRHRRLESVQIPKKFSLSAAETRMPISVKSLQCIAEKNGIDRGADLVEQIANKFPPLHGMIPSATSKAVCAVQSLRSALAIISTSPPQEAGLPAEDLEAVIDNASIATEVALCTLRSDSGSETDDKDGIGIARLQLMPYLLKLFDQEAKKGDDQDKEEKAANSADQPLSDAAKPGRKGRARMSQEKRKRLARRKEREALLASLLLSKSSSAPPQVSALPASAHGPSVSPLDSTKSSLSAHHHHLDQERKQKAASAGGLMTGSARYKAEPMPAPQRSLTTPTKVSPFQQKAREVSGWEADSMASRHRFSPRLPPGSSYSSGTSTSIDSGPMSEVSPVVPDSALQLSLEQAIVPSSKSGFSASQSDHVSRQSGNAPSLLSVPLQRPRQSLPYFPQNVARRPLDNGNQTSSMHAAPSSLRTSTPDTSIHVRASTPLYHQNQTTPYQDYHRDHNHISYNHNLHRPQYAPPQYHHYARNAVSVQAPALSGQGYSLPPSLYRSSSRFKSLGPPPLWSSSCAPVRPSSLAYGSDNAPRNASAHLHFGQSRT